MVLVREVTPTRKAELQGIPRGTKPTWVTEEGIAPVKVIFGVEKALMVEGATAVMDQLEAGVGPTTRVAVERS